MAVGSPSVIPCRGPRGPEDAATCPGSHRRPSAKAASIFGGRGLGWAALPFSSGPRGGGSRTAAGDPGDARKRCLCGVWRAVCPPAGLAQDTTALLEGTRGPGLGQGCKATHSSCHSSSFLEDAEPNAARSPGHPVSLPWSTDPRRQAALCDGGGEGSGQGSPWGTRGTELWEGQTEGCSPHR